MLVAFTGYGQDEDRRCVLMRDSITLVKPVDPALLEKIIDTLAP
jgi:hypothetical protein